MPQVIQVPNKLQMLGTMFSARETNVIEHFYLEISMVPFLGFIVC